jgi:hypothetical protein
LSVKAVRTRLGILVAATALAASACSSSGGGGGGVSQSQVESKLRQEPQLSQLKTTLKSHAKAYDTLISCAAKAIKKDADQSKLKAYVDGKTSIDKLGSDAQGKKAEADLKSCVKSAGLPTG